MVAILNVATYVQLVVLPREQGSLALRAHTTVRDGAGSRRHEFAMFFTILKLTLRTADPTARAFYDPGVALRVTDGGARVAR